MFNDPCSRRQWLMSAGATALSTYAGGTLAAPNGDGPKQGVYARAVLESAPLAYWRLDETRGPTARDATGHGNGARYVGNPTFGQKGAIASEPARAIGLSGPRTKSYVEVQDRDKISIATSGKGLTIEVWMRPDLLEFKGETAENYVHWLGKGEKGHIEWGLRFYPRRSDRPNRISAYVWNPDGSQGAGAYVEDPLTVGAWIYLVATFDDPRKPNAQARIYKNGRPSPHNESPGARYKNYQITPQRGPAPLRLGTRDLQSFLTGGLDEVALYPRDLRADEVLLHWEASQRGAERLDRNRQRR